MIVAKLWTVFVVLVLGMYIALVDMMTVDMIDGALVDMVEGLTVFDMVDQVVGKHSVEVIV